MKSNLPFTFLFIVISIIEISAALAGNITLVYVFKPAIVISLIGLTLIQWKNGNTKLKQLFLLGLIFALLGDIFLMIRGIDLFIPGLASFLVMQWIYIFTFRTDVKAQLIQSKFLKLALPFLAFGILLYFALFPNLPDFMLRIAVAIYAFSIATMAWMALLRRRYVSGSSFLYVFAGAILFMISDSLIALDRFMLSIPFNTIWVMGTYVAAQYLIVMGILKKQAGF